MLQVLDLRGNSLLFFCVSCSNRYSCRNYDFSIYGAKEQARNTQEFLFEFDSRYHYGTGIYCGLYYVSEANYGIVYERCFNAYCVCRLSKNCCGNFLPIAGATLLSTMFRCMEKSRLPLYASIISAIINTGLNYILIFGKLGITAMGVNGAAVATLFSQGVNFLVMFAMIIKYRDGLKKQESAKQNASRFHWKQYLNILLPILVCEALWSLGENVYAAIYGHMGTDASAAMTLINPVQGLMIGALCGLSQAAGIIIGKMLGSHEYDNAYKASKS